MKRNLMIQFNEPGVMAEIWMPDDRSKSSRLRIRRLKPNGKCWTEVRGRRRDNLPSSTSTVMSIVENELDQIRFSRPGQIDSE